MRVKVGLIVVVLGFFCHNGAEAHDRRCDEPPYAVKQDKYPVLVSIMKNIFGKPMPQMISSVCKMKYDGADRSPLYSFGFTDEQIDETETGQLVLDMLKALKGELNTLPPG